MTPARTVLPAIAAAVLFVAGCGGSSSSNYSGGGGAYGGGAPKVAKTTPAKSGATTAVKLQNTSFQPSEITAKVGQTITWTNDDGVAHNVTATAGATFKSADLSNGQTFSAKLTKAGTITYVCTIHSGMSGTIVVMR